METITIQSVKGRNEWFASFSTMDELVPTPFFLAMDKEEVIKRIQLLNPNSKVQ
jgi:hypothetical protein